MLTLVSGLRSDGVALAGDGLDEGGFAAAVGAEDGDVLAGVDGEVDVVEDDVSPRATLTWASSGRMASNSLDRVCFLIYRIDGFSEVKDAAN